MDLLGQRVQPLGKGVDLGREIRVLLQQVSLKLGELVSVPRSRLFVGLIRPRLRFLGDDYQRPGEERHG